MRSKKFLKRSNEEQSISVVERTEDWWMDVKVSAISRSSAYFA